MLFDSNDLKDTKRCSLLIEILAVKPGDKDPFSHKSMTDRLAAEVFYDISGELIRQESRLVVEREFRNMVSRYLSKAAAVKDAGRAGPLAPIVTDILDQVNKIVVQIPFDHIHAKCIDLLRIS